MKLLLALALVAATTTLAAADDDISDEFEPIGRYGQLGLGIVRRAAEPGMSGGDHHDFDGAFRLGKVWKAHDRVRPGGFFEIRTVDFDTFEVAAGPQVQLRISEHLALQLRGGLGAEANGQSYALAGVAVGNSLIAGSVTARRMFDDRITTVAVDVELPAIVALFPIAVGYVVANGGSLYTAD